MGSRTISLEQSAYERLAAAKREGESFSDVVNRLTGEGEPSLLDLVGLLPKDVADDVADSIRRRREDQARLSEDRRKRLWPEE